MALHMSGDLLDDPALVDDLTQLWALVGTLNAAGDEEHEGAALAARRPSYTECELLQ